MLGLDIQGPILIGVVHLPPLPGSPRYDPDAGMAGVVESAVRDAERLVGGGCHALIVENFGDAPFWRDAVPAETVASLARAVREVAAVCGDRPFGVNCLRNDGRAALGIAAACGASFVRINVLTGAAVTDQGLVQGEAAELARLRARVCPGTSVLADVHVKHAVPLGGGAIEDAAADTLERGGADAVIVSGRATGGEADAVELERVAERVGRAHVLLGSGVSLDNAGAMLAHAAGAIVGTALKEGGAVSAPVDRARVERMRAAFDSAG